jgi:hypothetical protein
VSDCYWKGGPTKNGSRNHHNYAPLLDANI